VRRRCSQFILELGIAVRDGLGVLRPFTRPRRPSVLLLLFALVAQLAAVGAQVATAPRAAAVAPASGEYQSVTPTRIVDSRSGVGPSWRRGAEDRQRCDMECHG